MVRVTCCSTWSPFRLERDVILGKERGARRLQPRNRGCVPIIHIIHSHHRQAGTLLDNGRLVTCHIQSWTPTYRHAVGTGDILSVQRLIEDGRVGSCVRSSNDGGQARSSVVGAKPKALTYLQASYTAIVAVFLVNTDRYKQCSTARKLNATGRERS